MNFFDLIKTPLLISALIMNCFVFKSRAVFCTILGIDEFLLSANPKLLTEKTRLNKISNPSQTEVDLNNRFMGFVGLISSFTILSSIQICNMIQLIYKCIRCNGLSSRLIDLIAIISITWIDLWVLA